MSVPETTGAMISGSASATSTSTLADPLAVFDPAARARLSAVADHLIPEAHDMPSAADVIDDARLRFVLTSRPDLVEPLRLALADGLPDEPARRLAALETESPDLYAALTLVIVGAYYTDRGVRERLGYPGQEAKQIYSWKVPEFIAEGLTDAVVARGPVWRDPATGRRAEPEPRDATSPDASRRTT